MSFRQHRKGLVRSMRNRLSHAFFPYVHLKPAHYNWCWNSYWDLLPTQLILQWMAWITQLTSVSHLAHVRGNYCLPLIAVYVIDWSITNNVMHLVLSEEVNVVGKLFSHCLLPVFIMLIYSWKHHGKQCEAKGRKVQAVIMFSESSESWILNVFCS